MRFVIFSVTTSCRPSGVNSIWADSGDAVLSERLDPGSGINCPNRTRNPWIFARVVAFPAFST